VHQGQHAAPDGSGQVQRQVRALQPMQRAARGQPLRPVDWDDVLDTVAARFAAVINATAPTPSACTCRASC
jgi:anaerobic selenocysteine-containing dehydrogenase